MIRWKKRTAAFALAALFLLAPAALAGEYTSREVTGCQQTDSLYDRFYQTAEPGPLIPGLMEGLVPQGISYVPQEDWLLFAGYRSDGANSALIAVDKSSGEIRRQIRLRNMDGSAYTGHAGGVCADGDSVYVSNNRLLYRLPLSALRDARENAELSFTQEIPVPVNASFCAFEEGILWVGEFEYKGDYPTDPSHRVNTRDGLQRAWICGYRMTDGQDFSAPDFILSVTERIQGVTLAGGRIFLSQSYGRKNVSTLLVYENVLDNDPDLSVRIGERDVPLYILDSTVRETALIAPPMTEGLCAVNGKVYILFESAAQAYRNPSNPSRNPVDRVFTLDPGLTPGT